VVVANRTRAVLETWDVVKHYGPRPALAGVSLEVRAGEVVGLLGPNGAGKSTLVSIVAGLCAPDSGRVRVDDIDVVADPSLARSRVGLAPQETGLYELLTVRENLAFFAELAGLRRRARAERIDELAHALRLDALLDRTAFELSGGERRRLHTAIAFVHRPSLLLLDEPTVGADVATRAALLDVVRRAADDGAAIVYSTHYLPEVEMLDATVALLVDGRLIVSGPLDVLVAAHGRAAVELRFDGPPPESAFSCLPATFSGEVVRIDAADPPTAVPEIMHRLGPQVTRLRGVELLRPSLDSVFVALTGRRYDAGVADVAAS
jgi:ABC-2 type transport system ATP-binding protein